MALLERRRPTALATSGTDTLGHCHLRRHSVPLHGRVMALARAWHPQLSAVAVPLRQCAVQAEAATVSLTSRRIAVHTVLLFHRSVTWHSRTALRPAVLRRNTMHICDSGSKPIWTE